MSADGEGEAAADDADVVTGQSEPVADEAVPPLHRSAALCRSCGSALGFVGAVGATAWMWAVATSGRRSDGGDPEEHGLVDRAVDIFVSYLPLLLASAGLVAAGLLLRLLADFAVFRAEAPASAAGESDGLTEEPTGTGRQAPADGRSSVVSYTRWAVGLGALGMASLLAGVLWRADTDPSEDVLRLGRSGRTSQSLDPDVRGRQIREHGREDVFESLSLPGDSDEPDLPDATLTVHKDGCGVIRTAVPADVRNLQWVIRDREGFQVLGRNALGERRYRYFRPGTYTAVLEAWGGESYVPISNTVTITC